MDIRVRWGRGREAIFSHYRYPDNSVVVDVCCLFLFVVVSCFLSLYVCRPVASAMVNVENEFGLEIWLR